jgi:hypothetical protein
MASSRARFRFVLLQEMFRDQQGNLLGLESPLVFPTCMLPAGEAQVGRKVSTVAPFPQHWDGLWSIFPSFLRSAAMIQKLLVPPQECEDVIIAWTYLNLV